MASQDARIDAVKTAVSSTTTCTPATVATLKDLLQTDKEKAANSRTPALKARTKPKAATTSKGQKSSNCQDTQISPESLSSRDRTILATHVINATLKALSEITKPSASPENDAHTTETKGPRRRSLRRSASAPLSPLQSRTLNRVATTPAAAPKPLKTQSSSRTTGLVATVECARVAFAALRSAKGQVKDDQTDFSLENGMATLVGKLISLGLHDQALRELRVMKRRLDVHSPAEGTEASAGLGDLLEYKSTPSQHTFPAIMACHMQVFRLVAATKKPEHIESLLPVLSEQGVAAPINLLLTLAKAGGKEAPKAARNMASLVQILFNIAGSVSSKDDAIAREHRLSPSPSAAFQLQLHALSLQIHTQNLTKQEPNLDKLVFMPFDRCLKALARRLESFDHSSYTMVSSAYDDVTTLSKSTEDHLGQSPESSTASIYQTLGSLAQAVRQYEDALRWFGLLKELLQRANPSIRMCAVNARMLAAALKVAKRHQYAKDLIQEVIEGLEGNLAGTAGELNELLESLSLARRSATGLLMNLMEAKETQADSMALKQSIEDFLLRYPRFLRRWLGTVPGKDAAPKQRLQFDQRRQSLADCINQILDAVFVVAKKGAETLTMDWLNLDTILQDCALLLNALYDSICAPAKADQISAHRVKLSNIYFTRYVQLRKGSTRDKDTKKQMLQALNRSIEVVKETSLAHQEKAQLTMKFELFADLCKASGRTADAVRTLRSICTQMSECGILSKVTDALRTGSPGLAWSLSEQTSILSRTLRTIAKLDQSWSDWTFFLPEAERAAVLEHLLQISAEPANCTKPIQLHDPAVKTVLKLCGLDRHPIRRLRVLLVVLSQNIGQDSHLDEIKLELSEAFQVLQGKTYSEDTGLAPYVPHFKAYHAVICALAADNDHNQFDAIMDAVTTWRSITETCTSKDELLARIDDTESLLQHLESVQKLAGLKGETRLQMIVCELLVDLSKTYGDSSCQSSVTRQSQLATIYLNMGLLPQASQHLTEIRSIISTQQLPRRALVEYWFSEAQYSTETGKTTEAADWLGQLSALCNQDQSQWASSRSDASMITSLLQLLESRLSLQRGEIQEALDQIKYGVRRLHSDWAKLERPQSESQNLVNDSSVSEGTSTALERQPSVSRVSGPRFWELACPLIRSLMQISSVYAHIGMFQETMYYAESAWKIAESVDSSLHKAEVSAWLGAVQLRASQRDKAADVFRNIEQWMPQDASSAKVRLARQLGDFHQEIGQSEKAAMYFKTAEEAAHTLAAFGQEPEVQEAVSKRQPAKSASARPSRTTKASAKTAPAVKRRGAIVAPKQTTSVACPIQPKDAYQASLLAAVQLSRAMGFVQAKDWGAALSIIKQTRELPRLATTASEEQIVTAVSLIGHSMEQMIRDPVFSVIQESTISFPAVSHCSGKALPETALPSRSPTKRSRGAARQVPSEDELPGFAESLHQAQELLYEAHASAMTKARSAMVHRVSTLLHTTMLVLSATAASRATGKEHASFATIAVDLARNVTWKRERKTLQIMNSSSAADVPNRLSKKSLPPRRSSIGLMNDVARFQKSYIENIPKKWNVISMSLSDNQHDLCITKFEAGHGPFILRLPLERANSRDADTEIFNFEQGRRELLDIIQQANATTHSAKDFTNKDDRNGWWAERESLDNRLKDLLSMIENTWLGGFKGIFSQHVRRSELLARFQKSFNQILDSCLPSRGKRQGKKAVKGTFPILDPRILDLFIGLGDPSDPDCDFDEALNDLLYFVVDVFQFHGERNAYDEIDFDAMMVETYDALRGYHAALKSAMEREEGAHTILVLDKALHMFPWESMPCMEGLAVSRVPSMACLRQLLSEAKGSSPDELSEGHHASPTSGTYILNPSSDLKNTEAFFQSSFKKLKSWKSITNRAPEESEFEAALTSSDVLVYFGHGSGAQYIRGKTIRRLEKCKPVTFLMGCSSAALSEAGDFECYGPVWNYMMAGCPAVVGTLWDVTDRDIDRFAGCVFEEWGLLPHDTFTFKYDRGKGNSRGKEGDEASRTSLTEAVARARQVCRFKYLNAASVVQYGIPAYLEKS